MPPAAPIAASPQLNPAWLDTRITWVAGPHGVGVLAGPPEPGASTVSATVSVVPARLNTGTPPARAVRFVPHGEIVWTGRK
jgi:hypothetical protein